MWIHLAWVAAYVVVFGGYMWALPGCDTLGGVLLTGVMLVVVTIGFLVWAFTAPAVAGAQKPLQICTGECQKSAPATKPQQKPKKVAATSAPLGW